MADAPVPPVGLQHAEDYDPTLKALVQSMQHTLRMRGLWSALRGGTAGRLCYNVSRISVDIDIDIEAAREADIDTLIAEAAEHARAPLALRYVTATPMPEQQRHHLKRTIHISQGGATPWLVGVDVRFLRGAELQTHRERSLEVAGITTYKPQRLAHGKIALVTEPGGRIMGRDRYDIAWWLAHRLECVHPSARVRLDRTLRAQPQIQNTWDVSHNKDRDIMKLVAPYKVRACLEQALRTDPVVLEDRYPNGAALFRVSPQDVDVTFATDQDHPQSEHLPIAQFPSPEKTARFMRDAQWRPQGMIQELLRDLQRERQNALIPRK